MSGFALARGPDSGEELAGMAARLTHRGAILARADAGGTSVAVLSHCRGHFRGAVGERHGVTVFIEGWMEDDEADPAAGSTPERLAAEFRHRGEGALAGLRGAFVAGVIDGDGGILIHRSALGQRPAYYWREGEVFAAASEVKAVLAHPLVERRLDPMVLGHLLVTGVEPPDRSLAAGVRKIPPGWVVELRNGGRLATRALSPVQVAVEDWPGEDAAASELRRRLDRGVYAGLGTHDGAAGVFLSGGVDSYLVAESIARQTPGRGQAGTAGVAGDAGDESRLAAERAASLELPHLAALWPDRPASVSLLELLDAAVRATEQPGRYENALLLTHLLQQWPDRPRVFFSGDMADVLFGDPYYRALDRAELLQRLVPWHPLRRGLGVLRHLPARRARSLAALAAMRPHDFRLYFGGLMRHEGAERVLGFDPLGPIQASFEEVAGEARELTRGQRYCYVHLRTSGQGSIDKLERLVSAAGGDLVHPFLAAPVHDLAMSLPPRLKYRAGQTKIVPRVLAERSLPRAAVRGSRRGFSAPRSRWVRQDESLREGIASLLDSRARLRSYVDGQTIDRLVGELAGAEAESVTDLLWVLLSAELWCRQLHV